MEKAKYDVFISYRREGGDKYARTIQQALEKHYRVFLDFDELKDGVFDQRIIDAISEAPVFLLILSKGALDRCVNENDWVRLEIMQAVKSGCHIVPVTIDDTFEGLPASLPEELRRAVGQHQFSELQMKTLFRASMEQLVRNRIEPYIYRENTESGAEIHIETDADCDMFRFKTFFRQLKAGEDNIIRLNPGKYKFDFVSTLYPDAKTSMIYSLSSEMTCDFIVVQLQEKVEKFKAEVDQKEEINNVKNGRPPREVIIKQANYKTREADKRPPKKPMPANIEEMYYKGIMYATSFHDNKKAIDYLERAAIAGHVEAQHLLGVALYNERDFPQASKWLQKAAEQGHPKAQYVLGKLYYKGYLGKVNYTDALKWFMAAANNGDDEANNMLGLMYEEGKGVTQDYNTAYDFYLIAANAGNVNAQCNIGYLIVQNKITHYKLDRADAIKWFEMAAKQGVRDAEVELEKLRK